MNIELFKIIALGVFLGNLPLVILNILYFGTQNKKVRKQTDLWSERFYLRQPDEEKILKLEKKKAQIWVDLFQLYLGKGGEKE